MGAWGAGPFENDDACDWLDELEDGGVRAIRDALALADDDGYLEAPDGSVLVAAAEVVACLAGRGTTAELPDEVLAFVGRPRPLDTDLVTAAQAAVTRVAAANSELRELWDADASWLAVLADLQRRLGDGAG